MTNQKHDRLSQLDATLRRLEAAARKRQTHAVLEALNKEIEINKEVRKLIEKGTLE